MENVECRHDEPINCAASEVYLTLHCQTNKIEDARCRREHMATHRIRTLWRTAVRNKIKQMERAPWQTTIQAHFQKHTKSPQQHRCHESAVRSFQRQHKLTRLRLLGWDTTVGITESTVADDAHDNEYFHSHSHRLERCPLLLFRTVGTRTVAGRMGNGNYRSIIVERRCAAVVIGTAVAWLRGQRQHR